MDIFNLIIGLIVGYLFGMIIKELKILIYVILSCFTAFWFIKIFHNDIYILPIYEWSWQNLFNENFHPVLFIIGTGLSYIIFYWGCQKIISILLTDIIEEKYKTTMQKVSHIELKKIKMFLVCIAKKTVWAMASIDTKISANKKYSYEYKEPFEPSEYKRFLINIFTISIHLCIAWITILPLTLYFTISFIILLLINIYFIFYYPFIKDNLLFLDKIITHEHNRNIK